MSDVNMFAFYPKSDELGGVANVVTSADFRKSNKKKPTPKKRTTKPTKKPTGWNKKPTKPTKTTSSNNRPNVEVPAGSRCKYVATFISRQDGLLDLAVPGNKGYKRNKISGKHNAVKSSFEQAFNDVNVVISDGAGAIEVNFTVRQNWEILLVLRQHCTDIMSAAVDLPVDVPFLAVTSKNQTIRNNPSDVKAQREQKRQQIIDDVYDTTKNAALNATNNLTGGLGDLFGNMGYILPIALLGGLILIVVASKK